MSEVKHYMDARQITEAVYDWDTDTIKVKVEATEMALNLNANEDSITVVPTMTTVLPGDIVNCAGKKRMCLYVISGTATVKISPVMNKDLWLLEMEKTSGKSVVELIAMRVKLEADGEAYLLLQG